MYTLGACILVSGMLMFVAVPRLNRGVGFVVAVQIWRRYLKGWGAILLQSSVLVGVVPVYLGASAAICRLTPTCGT